MDLHINNRTHPISIDDPSIKQLCCSDSFRKCFPVGSQFEDRYILSELIETLAVRHNFKTIKSSKTSMQCNCNKARETRSKGDRSPSITYKVGCSFRINIRGLQKVGGSYMLQKGDPCIITQRSNYQHTCNPSVPKFLATQRKSGSYTKSISSNTKYLLCMMLYENPDTPARAIRNMLIRCSTNKSQHWSPKHVWYTKINIISMIRTMSSSCLESFELFQANFNNQKFNKFLNCTPSSELDSVTDNTALVAKDVWKIMMNNNSYNQDPTETLLNFLSQLSELDNGFDYRISRNTKNEITGIVWMTSVMRASLEKFGDYIALDAMKAHMNTMHWPLISPSLKREDKTICVACESLIISECHDAYKFVVNSMFEMAPNAKKEDVYIISADGILDQSFISNELRLPNARYIYDHWHLINKVLPKTFGIGKFLEMKNDITSMITAKTRYDFEMFNARVVEY